MRVGSIITRLLVIPFALLGASAAPATNETDKIQGGWSADYLPAVANLALLLRVSIRHETPCVGWGSSELLPSAH